MLDVDLHIVDTIRNTDNPMIQSVERAFLLLYRIGRNDEHVSISQLARDVDLPRTTVARLLQTLQAVGAVKSVDGGDEYLLGDNLLKLLNNTTWAQQIIAVAQPYLQELAAQTGETVYLCLPDGDWCFYASQINTRYKIRVGDSTGERHPLHVTSAGKIFLAHRDIKAQNAYFKQELEQYTDYTMVSAESLKNQFEVIRQTNISWTRDEYEVGYIGVAAPIYNNQGDIVGAPSIGAPRFRIRNEAHEAELEALVLEAAQKITTRLS